MPSGSPGAILLPVIPRIAFGAQTVTARPLSSPTRPGPFRPWLRVFFLGLFLQVGLAAGETTKIAVVIPMVRVAVSTPNPAVNQTYELEIESFDGQSLRGFEPAKDPAAVRSMISISMASVLAIQFFNVTIEREAPKVERPRTPGPGDRDPNAVGPGATTLFKDLQRRLENPDGERSDAQLYKLVQSLKEPEYHALIAFLCDLIGTSDTEEKARNLAHSAVLAEFLHSCFESARNYEHLTRTAYFRQAPAALSLAQKMALEAAKDQANQAHRTAAEKAIEGPEWTASGLLWAMRVWNETVPADRIEEPGSRKTGLGPNGKPFKGLRPPRPADNP